MTGKEKEEMSAPRAVPARKDGTLGGVLLVSIGLLILANNLFPQFDISDYWPLILVAVGVLLILKSRRTL